MPPQVIQVCGDPTVDWMMVESPADPGRGPFFWMADPAAPQAGLSSQAGGAALLTAYLQQIIPGASLHGVVLDPALLLQPNAPVTRAWTMWQSQGHPFSSYRIKTWLSSFLDPGGPPSLQPTPNPTLLVIEDSNLGFRTNVQAWPTCLKDVSAPPPDNIIVKLAVLSSDAQPVLTHIVDRGLASRTTILISISDIRALPIRISDSLSWERTMDQVVAAVRSARCPFLNGDGHLAFPRVIVTIGTAGVVIVSRDGATLIFDRSGQEGDFQSRHAGEMMGYNTALLGPLAACCLSSAPDWPEAARHGLALARLLHVWGYEVENGSLRFPSAKLAAAFLSGVDALLTTAEREIKKSEKAKTLHSCWNLGIFTRTTEPQSSQWTILEESLRVGLSPLPSRTLQLDAIHQLAARITVSGPVAALPDVPVESIGKWKSADRHEIEGVRSVKNAVREYKNNPAPKPLAVAVFGPPGSGKSFAVKEVANDLGIGEADTLTFNLSQFESPSELAASFQQIQDLRLQGRVPLVFWDEFDSPCQGVPLGWLRYFLAPIQDGQFLDRGRLHPTGGGIYVFAGGTSSTFREFAAASSNAERTAKKPDFISRLRASIDVRGPNGDPYLSEDDLHVIRRSFLLHSLLKRYHPHLESGDGFQLGHGVLNAFLHTVRYRHGARSMETVIATCGLKGKRVFHQSSLPPAPILDMHVDSADFLSLAESPGHGREGGILRVGITGHIHLDPDGMPALAAGIGEAIAMIRQEFPGRRLTVFSPLAIGADRLVARAILETPGAGLIVVLPMPAEEYLNDFGPSDDHRIDYAGAEARQEFRHWLAAKTLETVLIPPAATRDESYENAGLYIARHCDVMVAVWDGQEPQGRGGTAQIVRHALSLPRTVFHVWAGNHKPDPAKRTSVGHLQGSVRRLDAPLP